MKIHTIIALQLLIAVIATTSAVKSGFDPFCTFVMCAAWATVGFGSGAIYTIWVWKRKNT